MLTIAKLLKSFQRGKLSITLIVNYFRDRIIPINFAVVSSYQSYYKQVFQQIYQHL